MSYRYGPSVFCIRRMKKRSSAAEGKANEELSASPIKKRSSAAGGKANEEKCAKTRICELWHTLLFFPHAIRMRRMIRILR